MIAVHRPVEPVAEGAEGAAVIDSEEITRAYSEGLAADWDRELGTDVEGLTALAGVLRGHVRALLECGERQRAALAGAARRDWTELEGFPRGWRPGPHTSA